MGKVLFQKYFDPEIQEVTRVFSPKFDCNGLITAVATDLITSEVLMVAHMNDTALMKSIETGIAYYWSRSRNRLWLKGETSKNYQRISQILTDCDQDAVILKVSVEGDGPSCHTGKTSCFYRRIERNGDKINLVMVEK